MGGLRHTLLALVLFLVAAQAWGQATQRREAIRPTLFEQMQAIQESLEAEDYEQALKGLDEIREDEDSLNGVERATLYNLYASIHSQQGRPEDAIAAYRHVLEIDGLREEMRNRTIFALGQTLFVLEEYERAVRVLERWLERVEGPAPSAYVLLAQGYYQLGGYEQAEKQLLQALRTARARGDAIRENWLGLLRGIYYQMEDYARAARVLELMVQRFPSESYYIQLSGMYGLMGERHKQLAVLHAAAVAGMISDGANLVNLARLYLVEEAPFPAVQVLERGLEDGIIEDSADNLQLYAQALGLAHEYDAQVEVLEALASKSGEAQHYLYLGQGLSELGRYDEAADAFREALNSGEARQPARLRMQLGMALYNAGRLEEARTSFEAAREVKATRRNAEQWLSFVDREKRRREALERQGE